MAVLNQGGGPGTTTGTLKYKAPICWTCHERRPGEIYEIDANGSPICATCANRKDSVADAPEDEPTAG
jgi:hypothetical protein